MIRQSSEAGRLQLVGPLQTKLSLLVEKDGKIGVSVEAYVKNFGKSPAMGVHTSYSAACCSPSRTIRIEDVAKRFAKEELEAAKCSSGRLSFPDETYEKPGCANVENYSDTDLNIYCANLIACTSYRVTYDSEIHQTVVVYSLYAGEKSGSTSIGQEIILCDFGASAGGFAN